MLNWTQDVPLGGLWNLGRNNHRAIDFNITLHDTIKPHNYPSDWNKPHYALFDQNMGRIKQTCGINQPCGQYRTREYVFRSPIVINNHQQKHKKHNLWIEQGLLRLLLRQKLRYGISLPASVTLKNRPPYRYGGRYSRFGWCPNSKPLSRYQIFYVNVSTYSLHWGLRPTSVKKIESLNPVQWRSLN